MDARFAIAHVTPYPWEAQENEVNTYVGEVARELSRRGHRVLILAPSRSQERVRASRRALRAARERPQSLLEGTDGGEPRVIAVGEVLDVPMPAGSSRPARALPIDVARTIEELLGAVELDFAHVHEPFAPSAANAALRHSRALNVGSFHAPTERLLSTLLGRRFVATFFGRLDARTASHAETARLMERHFPADYRLVAPAAESNGPPAGADTARPEADGAARSRADSSATGELAGRTWGAVTDDLEELYGELAGRRRDPEGDPALRRRLARRPLIDVDLHMHTDHSHDCATPVEVLLASAREQGLGAIAVTDHNEISGALEARELADRFGPHPPVKVVVGEEIKTAAQGEVIGLFIEERIPRGLTLEQTVAEIRRQGGLVYVPHPFDRLHSVPDYEHLLGVLEEVDAIEVFNPRVAIGAFNEEAARFAAKYRIVAGAGSDSHVAQGLGSVRVRMRDFEGPQEFLQSLRDAEIVTRPRSLLYVQALKFLETKATPPSARRARRARRVRRARSG
ncbi:MAG TPA: glycosyltransferase [Solirubrobacteraceae bacterium]|jgi:predicted metal-dependent phosphoesterase TrpH|nr:glycosyltransferase [Solirubrobacteraceae bacterium]